MKKTIIAAILAASMPAVANAEWSIKSLGTLGSAYSNAAGINNTGQVVGYIENFPGIQGFVTGINGEGMMTLGSFGDRTSDASNINNSGQVAGYYDFNGNMNFHAFITGPNGVGMTDLGTLGGVYSAGLSINNSGQVVGSSFTTSNKYEHAFITGPNGVGMTDLGTLNGKDASFASDINNSGQVVGGSYVTSNGNPGHAFITGPNGVGMTDLGTLDGKENSYATGINDSGQVSGTSGNYGGADSRAFITGPNGDGMIDLGAMGGDWSIATGINNFGQVIGVAGFSPYGSHANSFIYSDGVMVNLSYLDVVTEAGWTGLYARAINDNGQIVGHGILNGVDQAFLLSGADDKEFFRNYVETPMMIPEPSTYAMLLVGLGLVGFVGRKKHLI